MTKEIRIYEYHDAEGNIYWSFTESRDIITPPLRLKLRSRIGVHLSLFLSFLRTFLG